MVHIRLYTPADRPQIEACVVQLQDYEGRLDRYCPPGEQIAEAYVSDLLDKCARQRGKIYVAEAQGKVIGFIGLVIEQENDVTTSLREFSYITDVVVLPEFRGQGIGATLMAKADAYARESGYSALAVNVLANNDAALSLYQKMGFRHYVVLMLKELE
jgi:ribosomal protein S18 acetylase RimI-like enzyme